MTAAGGAKRYSLRRLLLSRLLVFLLPLVVLTLIGAFFATYHYINEAFDRSLARRAYALADQVEVRDGRVEMDLPQSAHDILEFDPTDVLYYRVIGPNGEPLAGTDDLLLPAESLTQPTRKATFYDSEVEGEPVRVAAYLLSLGGTSANGNVLILAGETRDKRSRLVEEVIAAMLLPMLMVIGLMAYGVSLGVDMSLKPIQALRKAISERSPQDLRPIGMPAIPNEIEPLLTEMNRLMTDVGALHDSSRHFLADAAHQLRTPLAALKAQTELTLRSARDESTRASLKGLLSTLDRQSHLIGQLLALSRAESAAKAVEFQPLDLVQLARDVAADWAPRALEQGIDLAFDAGHDKVWVRGDRNSLMEALSNLLDNALRYCRPGDSVTVVVGRDEREAHLSVADTGPGVGENELDKLFNRFYRVPGTQIEGCGLGLAIVKQIAQTHGGDARAQAGRDGHGLDVSLHLPLTET
ncbi:MAG TPA: sensor histidine kinase N-terminal domain-containing protein [Thiobacillaceae bacterium]|nr:sensor histidine kinase N-terminal domain-containing protein [Thiobacillaceae bacterium]